MFGLFEYSFNVVDLIIFLLFTTFILTQLSYWIFGTYFPSRKLCIKVHRNSSDWLEYERKKLKHLESISVFGFISTILLTGTVMLNVIILAMIFELFVPVGEILELPYLGSYGSFPLLVGALFALVEISFSALAEQNKKLNKSRWHIHIVLGVMIFMEAGLNFYRTKIMEEGMMVLSTSFLDQIIGWGGPVLAAFLGFIVPFSLVLLGGYAMIEFLMPAIKNTAILIRFCIAHLFIYLLILLFGFHPTMPVEVIAAIARLKDKVNKFKKPRIHLNSNFEKLKSLYPRVQILMPDEHAKIETRINKLFNRVKDLESQNDQLNLSSIFIKDENPDIFYSDGKKSLLRSAISKLKGHIRETRAELSKIECEYENVTENTVKYLKNTNSLNRDLQNYLNEFECVVSIVNELSSFLPQIHIIEQLRELESALNQNEMEYKYLAKSDLYEINALLDAVKSNKKDSQWYKLCLDLSKAVLESCGVELAQIQNAVKECDNWLEKHKFNQNTQLQAQIVLRMQELEHRLTEIDIQLNKTEKGLNDQYDEFQINLRELAWKMNAYIIWFSLFFSLQKRI